MENHDIKLVCFDMDGTLISNNKWFDFNEFLGVSPEQDSALFNDFVSGAIDYNTWIDKLVSLYNLKNKQVSKLETESVLKSFTLNTSAREAVEYLHKKGIETAVVTGSFDTSARAVATKLGIKHTASNTRCIYDESGFLRDIESDGEERASKSKKIKALAKELEIDTSNVAVVGDGGNELEAFKLTGNGITFTKSNAETRSAASHIIENLSDIKNIL